MEFQERFPDEAACLDYLAASRWPVGYRCPACESEHAWILERRHLWECSRCHQQTSVTAGTVMHGTRTPLRLWFWATYLVATHTPGISAKHDEFVFRHNRRRTPMAGFQTLLGLGAAHAPSTYAEITGELAA